MPPQLFLHSIIRENVASSFIEWGDFLFSFEEFPFRMVL